MALHSGKLGIVYALAYTIDMLTILRSETFTRWLRRLRDAHSVGNGISEMRFHFGLGYRCLSSKGALKSSLYCVAATRTAKSMTLGELSR